MDSRIGYFQACIFDFDGVIVNSEPVHERASRMTLEHFGIAYPPNLFIELIGKSENIVFRWVKDNLDAGAVTVDEMVACKHRMFASMSDEVALFPDVLPFVQAARRHFGAVGLATSAIRRDIERSMHRFEMDGWFDVIVSGDDTPNHKPDPEPYRMVLQALGVAGQAALVIEDTPAGLTSARGAGCVTAGLTTSWAAPVLHEAGADVVAGSLTELSAVLGMPLAVAA